jgi:hypothetical protein
MTFDNGNKGKGQPPGGVDVGRSSIEIVPDNPSRNWVLITNIGDNDVYGSCDEPAEVEKGFFLGANGGNLLFSAEGLSTGPIYGRTATGTSRVIYQEAN